MPCRPVIVFSSKLLHQPNETQNVVFLYLQINGGTNSIDHGQYKVGCDEKRSRTLCVCFDFSGIGLGIARAFAKAKYNIIFNGLEKNGHEIAAAVAKEFQVGHLYSPANALHTDQLRTMVDEGLKQFNHIG